MSSQSKTYDLDFLGRMLGTYLLGLTPQQRAAAVRASLYNEVAVERAQKRIADLRQALVVAMAVAKVNP